jgi:putative ABC transport system permease protein
VIPLELAWAYVRIALRVLRAHKLRSLLTVVSITIGAFSIVLMTSLADGGLQTIISDVEDMGGARLLLVTPDEPERMKDKRQLSPGYFTDDDRAALMDALPHLAESTWYAEMGELELANEGGATRNVDGLASDTGFLGAFGMHIENGRAFTEDENHTQQAVCVVGHDVAKDLFDGAAVGHRVTVKGARCLIVGQTEQLARVGMSFGFDWDGFVLLPLNTLKELDRQAAYGAFLMAKTDDVAHNDIVKRVANAVMMHRHHGVDDFELWDFSGIMGQFQQIFLILKLIVGFVASISLLVGGVGVMNMMFVSISERTKEIGIRKALGASPRAIEAQFLFEATFLSSIGGALGVGSGVAGAVVVNVFVKSLEPAWVGTISVPAVVTALVVSLSVGIGFGFVPARRAAQLDAVEAMRR